MPVRPEPSNHLSPITPPCMARGNSALPAWSTWICCRRQGRLIVPPERTSKQTVLLNRRILVGICGGIASYKAVELVSRLQQAGALVDVIMSEHAEEFIRPLTFSTMSHRPVYSDLWEPSGRAAETHIALAQDAELLAVIPATANTIAKLAHGFTDNMLTTVALATQAPLLLAPAMHH